MCAAVCCWTSVIAWRMTTSETKNAKLENARETSILFFSRRNPYFSDTTGYGEELRNDDDGKKAHAHYATSGIRLHTTGLHRFGPFTGLPAVVRARKVRVVVIADHLHTRHSCLHTVTRSFRLPYDSVCTRFVQVR